MKVSRRYVDSSSFKMALLFTILLSASAAILCYFLIEFGRRDFLRETEAAIDIEISMLSSFENTEEQLLPYIQRRAKDDAVVRFRYENQKGLLLGGSVDPMPEHMQKITEGVLGFDLLTAHGEQAFAAKIHTFEDGSRILVARNVHELIASYERLIHLSWLIMILMLVVVLVSFGISHFVVSRINRIAATAQHIVETGDLSQRLAIDSRWDDLSNLSEVLNGFLAKIEDLMNGVREVSNNIAHDLRTPLSGLRGDIEALKHRTVHEEQIDTLLSDVDHILAIFHALLRIANIEKGKRSLHMVEVDLGRIIQDVAELYEPLAEEREIRFDLRTSGNVTIKGDGDLLFQLFANLVDNAIKFAPEQSVINLSVAREGQFVVVLIQDQGPGIADDEKEKVFKHFYRGDASRSTPGNGLGLSLVRAVAGQHKARISLDNASPGLRVRILFQPYQ
ncbi:HAMP domain-containing sensor histidine kinase [Cellvibrio sp. UBA7661]|uniref:sensor histidine kinase n=1 Tax=Cellvibrio sp. UBA7661 TaxID=1946311 RepID=UPI002F355EA5